MAVARINKLEFYIHNSVIEDVLAILQKAGSCEIISRQDMDDSEDHSPSRLQHIDSLLSEIRFLLRFLEPYFNDSVSPMARALGERPNYSVQDLEDLSEQTEIKNFAEEMRTRERRLVEIHSEITQIEGAKSILSHLTELPYDLDLLSNGTQTVKGVVGTMPVDNVASCKQAIADVLRENGECFTASFGEKDKEAWVAIFYRRDLEQKALDMCSKFSLSRVDIPGHLTLSVGEELVNFDARREALEQEEEKILGEVSKVAEEWVPTVRALSDYWNILKSRYEALGSSKFTEKTVILKAWAPADSVKKLKAELAPYESVLEMVVSDPAPEDEPPTLLVNKGWNLPFETLTKLYGVPQYGELDPTAFLAPFFFVFFGMCLGDGGYGLVMLGFFVFFLKKFKRMPQGTKQFFNLFVLSGVATVIVGALTGSWFGDLIDVFGVFKFLRPLKNIPVLINPMDDPMSILFVSLALGVVQLFFGLFISFFDCLRKKDYMGAFADQGGWIVFLVGLLLVGGGVSGNLSSSVGSMGKTLALFGAAVLVLTQGRAKTGIAQKAISGVLSLYNVTSYLGDVLSYSRLLALGLASAAIASIINMLAGLAGGIPFVGWIIALVLILGGHLFSVAVNVLGAFVHSLRLQYVEFFSKFYSGGGRSFMPLTYKTHFVSISETKKS
jgi:V/A-type H+-transporting ATPase subunit I